MKKSFNLLIVIGMYLLIYNPPVLGSGMIRAVGPFRNMIWAVAPVSILYVICNLKWLKENLDWKAILRTECIIAAIIAYYMLVRWLNGNMTALNEGAGPDAKHWIYWMAGDISFALAVWISLRKKGQEFSCLLDHLLAAGTVMAATVILAYFIPPVQDFFIARMKDYGITLAEEMAPFRNFGFAANLSSTASYIQAVLASIALYRGVKEKKVLWLCLFPVLAFSANVNTRAATFFILSGMGAVMVSMFFTGDRKQIIRYAVFAFCAALVALFGLKLCKYVNEESYFWLRSGVPGFLDFLFMDGAEMTGYFVGLARMSSSDVLPTGWQLIFGTGMGVLGYNSKYDVNSDVGFVNDLWKGGIVLSACFYALYGRMLWKIFRNRRISRQDGAFFAVLFLLTFVLNNIKGSFFIHSDVAAVFWMLYAALEWNAEKGETAA